MRHDYNKGIVFNMRKITKKMTKRRGFTLIEILLVLAIMVMFISIIFSTFYLVNASHANVVVINDAKDFAALNMEAISKLVVNAESVKISGDTYSGDTYKDTIEDGYTTNIYYKNSALYIKNAIGEKLVFSYYQYTVSGGMNKWRIKPTFTASGTLLIINLDILYNASASTTPYYTLTRTVLLPNVLTESDIITETTGDSSAIKFKDKY